MKLIEALDLKFPKSISLVGAGGKTSFIFTLAREAADLYKSVLITTTTAIFNPEFPGTDRPGPSRTFDRILICPARDLQDLAARPGTIIVAAPALKDQGRKLAGYSPLDLAQVLRSSRFDLILIEADGARMCPVKAPASHEPVIPRQTDMVAGCIGLDCLGIPLEKPNVHRPEILAELSGQQQREPVTAKTLTLLAKSKQGLFKSTGPGIKKILVLNKADSPALANQGESLGKKIMPVILAECCLITCFLNPEKPVVQKLAGIRT